MKRAFRIAVLANLLAGCGLSVVGVGSSEDAGPAIVTPTPDAAPMTDATIIDATPLGDATPPIADAAIDATVDAGAKTALSFNGTSDNVRMNRPVQDDFTLEAWIKSSDPGGTGTNFYEGPAIWHSDTPGPNNDFGSSILNKKFAFGTGMPDTAVVSTSDVATGQWVHVAAVRVKSSGTVTVFVNGIQEASTPNLNTASLNKTPTMDIGANFGNAHFFNGVIDEVRAWNVARTAAQIQGTMRTRLVGNEPNLVGYWRFDDGKGTSALDDGSGHHNGQLGGVDASTAPAWVPSTAF